jgi:hypothetical protein
MEALAEDGQQINWIRAIKGRRLGEGFMHTSNLEQDENCIDI